MATAKPNPLLDIEYYIQAAEEHGNNSDQQDVGDLIQFLRTMWSLLTPEQRLQFAKRREVHLTLDGAEADFEDHLAKLP